MPDKEAAKQELKKLIARYETAVAEGKVRQYNEERTKKDFILPLFHILGWATETEEVTAEDKVSKGRVDYGFRINELLKLVVEAKPLRADLDKPEYAQQAVDYAWHKGISWAVLTNFEKIILFNADLKLQNPLQNAKLRLSYRQFLDRFEDLWLLSKDSIEDGMLEAWGQRYAVGPKKVEVGEQILADLMGWRELLTKDINKHPDNKKVVVAEEELDESVQRVLDRLIFIRTCEDREFEEKLLHQLLEGWRSGSRKNLLNGLVGIFEYFNENYDSKLFLPHSCDKLVITNDIIVLVLDGLYRTKDRSIRYDFSLVEADVLGSIYENYLGHVLRQTAKRVTVTDTPNHRKQLGIYYTPPYIVNYIVKNTLGELLKEKKSEEIKNIKVLDPACGSGSFLIKAFDAIAKAYEEKNGEELPFAKKKDVLVNNIFGVDLDTKAVEITQLNLMLKAVEKKKLLPMLQNNVKNGNSLIDDPSVAGDKAFKWEEQFPEIMKSGGFDVVIGNPPYVRQEELLPIKPYLESHYKTFDSVADLFVYFFEKEINLLKEGGYFGMIVSNKWLRAGYGKNLRAFITNYWIEEFIDFGDLKVFPDATIYPCIIIIKKVKKNNPKVRICKMTTLSFGSLQAYVKQKSFLLSQKNLKETEWNIQREEASDILTKITQNSVPLEKFIGKICYGIKTGFNEAFIIDEETKNKLISEDKKSAEILKPYLIGSEIKRYSIKSKKLFIILTKTGIEINKYPAIKKWLIEYQSALQKRWDKGNHWYELRACAYYDSFEKSKIIWGNLATQASFTHDEEGYYVNAPACILPTTKKYVLGILNSRLISYFLKSICAERQGGFIEQKPVYVSKIPIKEPSPEQKEKLLKLVDKILVANKRLNEIGDRNTDEKLRLQDEIKRIDAQIDELVYQLYGITDEEKKIIEESLK